MAEYGPEDPWDLTQREIQRLTHQYKMQRSKLDGGIKMGGFSDGAMLQLNDTPNARIENCTFTNNLKEEKKVNSLYRVIVYSTVNDNLDSLLYESDVIANSKDQALLIAGAEAHGGDEDIDFSSVRILVNRIEI